jgi:hypothetical protein
MSLQEYVSIDILVNNSPMSVTLLASLASVARLQSAMKEIVHKIARIVITTISSTRVKADITIDIL